MLPYKDNNYDKLLRVRVNGSQLNWLKKLAKNRRTDMSKIIRELIIEEIERHRKVTFADRHREHNHKKKYGVKADIDPELAKEYNNIVSLFNDLGYWIEEGDEITDLGEVMRLNNMIDLWNKYGDNVIET